MGDMKCLLLLLCAGVTVSTAVDLQKRIINGSPCGNEERRYHVKLIASNGKKDFFCGGSLISESYILTAAHCWKQGWNMTALVGVHPGPPEGVKITEHHIYNDTNGNHDIMLLKLPQPTQIPYVALPNENKCSKFHKILRTAGHGATIMGPDHKRGSDRPKELHCADIPVFQCPDYKNCLRSSPYRTAQYYSYQHFFCSQSNTVDISPGDSGGGAVHKCRIYGVNAFVANGTHACVNKSGYMDVCEYMPWIKDKVGLGFFNKVSNKALSKLGGKCLNP
ncbi:trypsin-5-like [Labrus mixtus]|uniref:trypsin-5-like n=1 Tax=Labrus mixtus TaxID=508554 RepID=UPI0029C083FA|nr:trypsin-5-like [Labrus mixtus]